jgi:hypothetical protein
MHGPLTAIRRVCCGVRYFVAVRDRLAGFFAVIRFFAVAVFFVLRVVAAAIV